MKKNILLIAVVFILSSFAFGQEDIPVAPATPVVRDDNIKLRSVELERVKRDAAKAEAAKTKTEGGSLNTELDKKYPEIKEDFEGMQIAQSAIIKAYTTGETIDYATIETSANQINKNAKRLESNLFTAPIKKEEKDEKEKKETKSVRDLIIDLDKAIGDVTTSAMFKNLRVVDPEIAEKTHQDIDRIMTLSDELSKAAKDMK